MTQSSTVTRRKTPTKWLYPLLSGLTSKRSLKLILFAIVLPIGLYACLIYLFQTLVSGTEFNPNTLQFRDFSFQRDPATSTQFTGIVHAGPSVAVTIPAGLRAARNAATRRSNRWDLVRISAGINRIGQDGAAMILVRYLRASDASGSSFWDDWTKKEPVKSVELWRTVYELIQLNVYCDLPAVFELALEPISADQFKHKLKELVTRPSNEAAR